MNVYILNSTYTPVAVIDAYKSLIWTKRYYTYGDFELYMPADDALLEYLKPGYFVTRDDDDSVMMIEKLQIKTDVENGDFFIVSGPSLESLLAQRIVYPQTVIETTDPVQGIKTLIEKNTTLSVVPNRSFPGLIINTDLSVSGDLTMQFTGDTLSKAVESICRRFGIGCKVALSGSNIILSFYLGSEVDVIFSPEFDNLINSQYTFDISNEKNAGFVAGEGEGTSRKWCVMTSNKTGLERRELFVDARDVSSNEGEIPMINYIRMLDQRGRQKLNEHIVIQSFEAEIEPRMTYQYKTDYNLGDIVTIVNEYGITSKPRITEIIESWDETGYTVIPTFEELEVV